MIVNVKESGLYFSALNKPNENHDDCDSQKNVNETTYRIGGEQSQ